MWLTSLAAVDGGAKLTRRPATTAASSEVIEAVRFESVGGVSV
jgi:hypothetical protein